MRQLGRRGAATALAIEDAALDLVLEHGYDRVTVDMICRRAGISQRTFFNHFPAKEDAVLGGGGPVIDQRAARRFIVSRGPLLPDAVSLLSLRHNDRDQARLHDRMRAIASSPALLARQMERVGTLEAELREIISLRIENQNPRRSEADRADEAALVTQLLAGVLRFVVKACDEVGPTDTLTGTQGAGPGELAGAVGVRNAAGPAEQGSAEGIAEGIARARATLGMVLEDSPAGPPGPARTRPRRTGPPHPLPLMPCPPPHPHPASDVLCCGWRSSTWPTPSSTSSPPCSSARCPCCPTAWTSSRTRPSTCLSTSQ